MPVPQFLISHMPAIRASAALENIHANMVLRRLEFLESHPGDSDAEVAVRVAFDAWMMAEQERTR